MQHGGKRAGAGRKPSSIDLGELEKLCGLQCTDEDVAGVLDVKVRTIERRRQREAPFAAAMERGRAKGHISVRHGLHVQALKGNITALTFLGKHLPGYRDAASNEPSGPDLPKKDVQWSKSITELLMAKYRDIVVPDAE